MNNPESTNDSKEESLNTQNEWEKMSAEMPDFDPENAKAIKANEIKEKAIEQMENGENTIERYKGFLNLLNTGDVKGYEETLFERILYYKKDTYFLWKMGKISYKEHDRINKTARAFSRYISGIVNNENPEEPTRERPKFKDRISDPSKYDLAAINYKLDQEEINVLKTLSPETKKSLDAIGNFHKEHVHPYYSNNSMPRPNKPNNNVSEQKPQEPVELPQQGPIPYSPLFNEYPYNPFQ